MMHTCTSIPLVNQYSRRLIVRVHAENKPQSTDKKVLPLLNTELAKQRNATIKENINKLIAIATNDVKEFNELIKELDIEHKKALKFASYEDSKEQPTNSGTESDDENIFISNK